MSYKHPFRKPLRPVQRAGFLASLCCQPPAAPPRACPADGGPTAAAGPPAPALSTVRWLAAIIDRLTAAPPIRRSRVQVRCRFGRGDAGCSRSISARAGFHRRVRPAGASGHAGHDLRALQRSRRGAGTGHRPGSWVGEPEAASLPRIEIRQLSLAAPLSRRRSCWSLRSITRPRPPPATPSRCARPRHPAIRPLGALQAADGAALTWAFETTRPSVEGFGPTESSEPARAPPRW